MIEDKEKKLIKLFHMQGYGKFIKQNLEIFFGSISCNLGSSEEKIINKYIEDIETETFSIAVELLAEMYTDEEIDFLYKIAEHPMQKQIREKYEDISSKMISRLNEAMKSKEKIFLKELGSIFGIENLDDN